MSLKVDYNISSFWNLGESLFTEEIANRGSVGTIITESWYINFPIDVSMFDIALSSSVCIDAFSKDDDYIVHIEASKGNGKITVNVWALSKEICLKKIEELKLIYPEPIQFAKKEVAINFWVNTPQGPSCTRRKIAVVEWCDVRDNYTANTQNEIEKLLCAKIENGKLVLWQGIPGTGKTYMLRALAWEWRNLHTIHYIVDPEYFLGEARYLCLFLSGACESDETYDDPDDGLPVANNKKPCGTLIVLEDAGELVGVEARINVGQGLSRLLNLTDGLLGQGLNISILITTNEEMGKLHPAVCRPGRCLQKIVFDSFTHNEALSWCNKHNVDPSKIPSGKLSLAELYALKANNNIEEKQNIMGFVV